jgi:molecular chaperone DnaK (HSP70)
VRKGQEYVAEKDNAVLEAVICVPAKYDSVQKHCTKSAAEQAGIKVDQYPTFLSLAIPQF